MTPTPFTHAAASFDPTQDAVLLWTRAVGVAEVEWVLARDRGLVDVVARGTAPASADHDWAVTVDAAGLEPGTTYWYAFSADAARTPVGRTRTLPGPGEREAVLGLVCCADYSVAPLSVYRALAQREVDLVVHLGDYVYDSPGKRGRRDHVPPHRVRTLADYRARIGQMRSDPDCQALHLQHPMAVVVDDHDLADNAWKGGAKAHDEDEDGPWADRALAAMTARSEWLPCRRPSHDVTRTWRALPLGELGELVLLDSRLHGRDQQASLPGALPLQAEERTILGPEQREWALDRVTDTSRPWAAVVNGVVVNEMLLPAPRGLAPAAPEGYAVQDGVLLRDDQWDGYPAERRRLVDALATRRATGGAAVLLSGDVHSSWAFDGPRADDGEAVAVEAVTPSVSSAPMGRTRLPGVWRLLDGAARRLESVRFADVTHRGFTVVHVRADEVLVGWHWVDPYDPADEPAVTPGCWLAVPAQRPGWEPAASQEPPAGRGDADVPVRPADVLAARRLHQRRRAAGLLVVLGGPAAAALALARRGSRRG